MHIYSTMCLNFFFFGGEGEIHNTESSVIVDNLMTIFPYWNMNLTPVIDRSAQQQKKLECL